MPELHRSGRTLARGQTAIVDWHRAGVTNEPADAHCNLVKGVKRAAFGFHRFTHCRIQALLYAGKPNWAPLPASLPGAIGSATTAAPVANPGAVALNYHDVAEYAFASVT